MLQLSSFSDLLAAIERGRDIAVSAYTLGGPLVHAIESRARSGTRVAVALEADPSADNPEELKRHNAAVTAALRSYGVDAKLEHNVHSKAVIVDGATFLDGSNWRRGDVILRGSAGDTAGIATIKSAALKDEGEMLECARTKRESRAIVETETFDRFNVVSKALREMAAQGLSPRLLVDERALRHNARELSSLGKIAAQGVDVRVCSDTEKFALAGDSAWLGSANATAAYGGHNMSDWGTVTENAPIVDAVRARVEQRWATARAFRTLPVA